MSKSSHLEPEWRPLTLSRAVTRVVRSRVTGHDYRLSVSIPEGEAPAKGFPSLLVLDGTALFASVAETERRLSHRPGATGVTPTVVIGIGHVGEGLYDTRQRHRDFTPGPPVGGVTTQPFEYGGADAMLGFLCDQVLPETGRAVPLDPSRRALLGHSLAGYFTLHALTTLTGVFATYGAISPSIWWNPDHVRAGVGSLSDRSVRLFMAAGELEQTGDSAKSQRQMVEAMRALGTYAAEHGLADVEALIIPDENHASVVMPAVAKFLRFNSRSPIRSDSDRVTLL